MTIDAETEAHIQSTARAYVLKILPSDTSTTKITQAVDWYASAMRESLTSTAEMDDSDDSVCA